MPEPQTMTMYALVDPITQRIRYVGRSANVLGRYAEHCRGRSYGNRTKKGPVSPWIDSLLTDGLKPQLRILEELPFNGWEGREAYWIRKLQQESEPLLNTRNDERGYAAQPVEQRFWKRVDKNSGIFAVIKDEESECWLWTGARSREEGYGTFHHSGDSETPRTSMTAHRFSYELHNGSIPEEKRGKKWHLDHLCRHRSCIRPDHLELIPRKMNILRGEGITAKNAVKTHCPRGHAYEGDNVYLSKRGMRHCKACARAKEKNTLYGPDHVYVATHCKHGHEFTEENTYLDPRGVRFCVVCRKERNEAKRLARPVVEKVAKVKLIPEPKIRVPKTHCPKGHAYTPDNIYLVKNERRCRTCSIATTKAGQAKRRADPEQRDALNRQRREERHAKRTGNPVAVQIRTTCRKGHPWTPENEDWFQGARHCKQCRLDRMHAAQAARVRKPHHKSIVTSCPRGHAYDEANTYLTKTGARSCRTCSALAQNEYRKRSSERNAAA